MIDPSGMSQYEERKESVFGPGFRPWIKNKRRLRAVQEMGAENQTPIIIPKIKYMVNENDTVFFFCLLLIEEVFYVITF
jgi:hypothetical protein